MSDSILTSIKKLLGIREDDTNFDQDIIIHINTALSTLTQLGVGPIGGFFISDKNSEWSDFLPNSNFESVKSYIYLRVKLLFDPPLSSAVKESMMSSLSELEYRINVTAESKLYKNQNGIGK